jgi:glycine/D-amino acid oxidase-like deaminating enzyme
MDSNRHKSVDLPRSSEFVIIGAGVIGLAAAWFLRQAGKETLVLDRSIPMGEASGVNAGTMGMQNKRLPLISYSIKATEMWKQFQNILGEQVAYIQCGGIRVASSPKEIAMLRSSAVLQMDMGLELEWIEKEEVAHRVPWLGEGIKLATYCALDGYANPLATAGLLNMAVQKTGGLVCADCAVTLVKKSKNGYRLQVGENSTNCRKVVIAAGAWSAQVAGLFGVDLPVTLDVNMLTVTEPSRKIMDLIVTHIKGILTLKQLPHGSCIIGGGWQGRGELKSGTKDLNYTGLLHNIRLAVDVVPALKNLHILRSWSGFEGVTPDSLPYLGRLPGHDNVYIAACARGGWTLGPLLAKLITEKILTGKTSLPLDVFDPARFQKSN